LKGREMALPLLWNCYIKTVTGFRNEPSDIKRLFGETGETGQ
jgi:hypothetical protein